jgi:hypothetical protein
MAIWLKPARRTPAARDSDVAVGLFAMLVRLLIFGTCNLVLIVLCLIFCRPSLALALWGPGMVMSFVAGLTDADSGMYRRDRWKAVRRQVYARNIHGLGQGRWFVCEATGERRSSLAGMHVDHKLARSRWPLLAYRLDNLRLVCDHVNIEKSDKLCGWSLIRFVLTKKVR